MEHNKLCIFGLIILIAFVPAVGAVIVIDSEDFGFSGVGCSSLGNVLTFNLHLSDEATIYTKNILVYITSEAIGEKQLLNGAWDKEKICFSKRDASSCSLADMSHSNFVSEEGKLIQAGNYTINVSILYGSKNITREYKTSCIATPKFICNIMNISIKECYAEKDNLYFKFEAKNIFQSLSLDVYKDLKYYIKAKDSITQIGKTWDYDKLPDGMIVEKIGDYEFSAKVPYPDGIFEELRIKLKDSLCDYNKYPDVLDREIKCIKRESDSQVTEINKTNNQEQELITEDNPENIIITEESSSFFKDNSSIFIVAGAIVIGAIVIAVSLKKRN